MRVQVVDPSAYTLPYDASLCAALARQGAQVELVTSSFAYGEAPAADGYRVRELFYRRARGAPSSRTRAGTKLLEHIPNMLSYRAVAREADLVHFQWLPVQWLDRFLLPERPVVLTAHDLLPREPRTGQVGAQRRLYDDVDAIVTHSLHGRDQLVGRLGVEPAKVAVIHHGAFDYLAELPEAPLPAELKSPDGPVVLFFGLLRPYKGVEILLQAWAGIGGRDDLGMPELWVVGRPRMSLAPLQSAAAPGVRFVPRFVTDAELAACFRRADVVVLPYVEAERLDFSGVLATALAFGKPAVISDVGGFSEVAAHGAARLAPPGDAAALAGEIGSLLQDPEDRQALARAASVAAAGPYSWEEAARLTLDLYRRLVA
jgi:glycosyltransferase involved in cell wall biosynthesis